MTPIQSPAPLICHPATPAPLVRSLEATAEFQPDGNLLLNFCLRGDIARLRIPERQTSGQADLLWEHTCFEAFVAQAGASAYVEFNFSPSGQWASYAFSDYRQRIDTSRPSTAPTITSMRSDGRLEVCAVVASDSLPGPSSQGSPVDGGRWDIGLSAVVEAVDTVDGCHSYWALHHVTPQPDFHQRGSFVLSLQDPGAS